MTFLHAKKEAGRLEAHARGSGWCDGEEDDPQLDDIIANYSLDRKRMNAVHRERAGQKRNRPGRDALFQAGILLGLLPCPILSGRGIC